MQRAAKPYGLLMGEVTAGAAESRQQVLLGDTGSLRDFARRVAIRVSVGFPQAFVGFLYAFVGSGFSRTWRKGRIRFRHECRQRRGKSLALCFSVFSAQN